MLSLTDDELLTNLTSYRCMVGALKYITMTRPNIAHAAHVVSQFIHVPRTSHLTAIERIFKNLQGTTNHGLLFEADCCIVLAVVF